MTSFRPRLTPQPLGRAALLAALAIVAAACSPAGNAPAVGPHGLPGLSDTAAASAAGTTRYFGDEFADQERALRDRPVELFVATY